MVNKVFIQGNITKDIELRTTNSGLSVCSFDIAHNYQESTDFFRVECWEKLAENVAKFCGKGSKVLVEGKLSTDTYEKDGQKRTAFKIKAFAVEFLDTKKENGSNESTEDLPQGNFNNIEDDLPF